MSAGTALALAAERLAGTPFRLHGRDPRVGLDCVGLYTAAMAGIGRPVTIPPAYGLRNTDLARALRHAPQAGLRDAAAPIRAGDVLLLRVGPAQAHLVIALAGNRMAHAHAGLRKVLVSPGPLAHPVIRHWRIADHP